jgi:hypothetical protein
VFHDNRKFKDFTTGEGGDAADFLAKARGISLREACRQLIRLAGIPVAKVEFKTKESESCDRKEEERKARQRTNWPQFDPPSIREIETIAKLRTLSAEGVSLAADRGLHSPPTPRKAAPAKGLRQLLANARRAICSARLRTKQSMPLGNPADFLAKELCHGFRRIGEVAVGDGNMPEQRSLGETPDCVGI